MKIDNDALPMIVVNAITHGYPIANIKPITVRDAFIRFLNATDNQEVFASSSAGFQRALMSLAIAYDLQDHGKTFLGILTLHNTINSGLYNREATALLAAMMPDAKPSFQVYLGLVDAWRQWISDLPTPNDEFPT